MKIETTSGNLQSGQINSSGDNGKVTNKSVSQSTTSTAPAGAASGQDRISLTESATRLQTLTDQVKMMPVVDLKEVEDVQRTLATGGLHIADQQAADNLLDQEKAFAMIEMQE
jgi:negative regulator of flagellin synthesis FlgM